MNVRMIVVALAVVGLLAAQACGGGSSSDDGRLSMDEYFTRLEQISNDLFAQTDDDAATESMSNAIAAMVEDGEVSEVNINVVTESLDAYLAIVQDFFDQLDVLEPPGDVEAAHDELVSSTAAVMDEFAAFSDDMSGVESVAELNDLALGLSDRLYAAGGTAFDGACHDLQDAADEADIDVDIVTPLECDGPDA
jgi:hypothetical protein